MANIALTSIGVKIYYAVETVAGTRPADIANYVEINGLKSTPDFNQSPTTADATTFANLEYTTKVALLKELPDALEFNAIFGQQFADDWATLISAYEAGRALGKATWFCIDIKGFNKSIYFTGEPIKMGMPGLEVNSVIECPVYIIPTGEPVIDTDLGTTEYKITVTVTGATAGDEVAGATVELIGSTSKITNEDGVVEFYKTNGTYDLKITKAGITTQYKEAVVNNANVSVSVTGFNA